VSEGTPKNNNIIILFNSENRETNFLKMIDEDQNKNRMVKALKRLTSY
jgi:hypothetical protein